MMNDAEMLLSGWDAFCESRMSLVDADRFIERMERARVIEEGLRQGAWKLTAKGIAVFIERAKERANA